MIVLHQVLVILPSLIVIKLCECYVLLDLNRLPFRFLFISISHDNKCCNNFPRIPARGPLHTPYQAETATFKNTIPQCRHFVCILLCTK
jgi:hypothetical protein